MYRTCSKGGRHSPWSGRPREANYESTRSPKTERLKPRARHHEQSKVRKLKTSRCLRATHAAKPLVLSRSLSDTEEIQSRPVDFVDVLLPTTASSGKMLQKTICANPDIPIRVSYQCLTVKLILIQACFVSGPCVNEQFTLILLVICLI